MGSNIKGPYALNEVVSVSPAINATTDFISFDLKYGANSVLRLLTDAAGAGSIQLNNNAGTRGLDLYGSTAYRSYINFGLVIGNTTLDASARLQVDSTAKGVLFPRMTTVQKNAIGSPVEGLIVYDTDLHKLCVKGAAAWETITSS